MCWPSPYTLSLMQQFAVNKVVNQDDEDAKEESDKIFAVNGPPGSGKTTLLRDIIAANLVKKVQVQGEIDDPKRLRTKEIGRLEKKKNQYIIFMHSKKIIKI